MDKKKNLRSFFLDSVIVALGTFVAPVHTLNFV